MEIKKAKWSKIYLNYDSYGIIFLLFIFSIVTLIYRFIFKVNVRFFSKKNDKDQDLNKKKCKYCDMIFDEDERLKRHIRKAHSTSDGDMPNFNPFGT